MLVNEIDSGSESKDGKMAAVHGLLLEQQQTLCVLEKAWRKVSQASVNVDGVSSAFFSAELRTHQTQARSLNETTICVQSIFHNVLTEVGNKKA